MKITFNPSARKEVKYIIEKIDKQQYTVGKNLQELIINKKQEEGNKTKIREYMLSQRTFSWEVWRSSNLIQSILLGIPIPEVTIYRHDSNSQYFKTLDGNQRWTTIYLFVNNMIKLDLSKSIFPNFEIEGENYTYSDIQGKTFDELPEIFKEAILNYEMQITIINNCTEEMAEKFFVSMNAGVKPLKPAEIRTAAMGISTRKFYTETLKSDWILHCLTAKSATTNTGSEVISQALTLMHNKLPIELSKENIDKVIYSFRDTGVPENLQSDMVNICNYLNEATSIWIDEKKIADSKREKGKKISNYSTYRFSFFNKTSTVMLMMAADKAIKNNVPVTEFAKWAYKFFEKPNQDYKDGMVEKVNELKMVDLRMLAIDAEIVKMRKEEPVVVKQTYEEINAILEEFKNESESEHNTKPKDNSTNDNDNVNIQSEQTAQFESDEIPKLTIEDIPEIDLTGEVS